MNITANTATSPRVPRSLQACLDTLGNLEAAPEHSQFVQKLDLAGGLLASRDELETLLRCAPNDFIAGAIYASLFHQMCWEACQ